MVSRSSAPMDAFAAAARTARAPSRSRLFLRLYSGETGIRTLGTLAGSHDFQPARAPSERSRGAVCSTFSIGRLTPGDPSDPPFAPRLHLDGSSERAPGWP